MSCVEALFCSVRCQNLKEVIALKSLYYAHSLRIYNTPQEELELKQIASLCPSREIINPNGVVNDIKEAYQLIDKSDGVVASEYHWLSEVKNPPVRHIGKGVHDEICHALGKKKLVVVLRDGHLFRVYSEHQIEVVDADWAVHYAKIHEGFVIPPLSERLAIEQVKAKKMEAVSLDNISGPAKELLVRMGRIQILVELFGHKPFVSHREVSEWVSGWGSCNNSIIPKSEIRNPNSERGDIT